MKKVFILLTAFSILLGSTTNNVMAQENEPTLVCHYELDENGEWIEVCEEISTYEFCSPECWNV